MPCWRAKAECCVSHSTHSRDGSSSLCAQTWTGYGMPLMPPESPVLQKLGSAAAAAAPGYGMPLTPPESPVLQKLGSAAAAAATAAGKRCAARQLSSL